VENVTLKGKKNHYNVKLLRGYGVSINLKDNRLCLKDNKLRLKGGNVVLSIPDGLCCYLL
jgi:hypothetical protein